MSNIELAREIFDAVQADESGDNAVLYDRLAEDIVYECTLGSLGGRDAVIGYFDNVAELVDADPFQRPLQYFDGGERVAILGLERFEVRATGAAVVRQFAWFLDFREGLIIRISEVQDLSGVVEAFEQALQRTSEGG
jgi:ketosteroid isomerase-like protein